jgi:uncharacterized protein
MPDRDLSRLRAFLFRTLRIVLIAYFGLCIVMWSIQGALLFPARAEMSSDPSRRNIPFEEVRLPVDGEETFAWYAPLENARGVVLFSHGNAGNLSGRVRMVERLQSFGFSVLAYDYGGYGYSTGSPSEKRFYADIRAMWDYLVETRGVPEEEILLYGRSVGGGPTCELAKGVTPGAVILESTFLSTSDVAWDIALYRPFLWLLRHKFKNKDKVADFNAPLLILHSRKDEIIPYEHGQGLFDRAKEPKTFVEIKGGHNDGFEFSEKTYRRAWETFLTPIFGEYGPA